MSSPRKRKRLAHPLVLGVGRPIQYRALDFDAVRMRGDLLELQRRARGWSQEELAKRAGVMRYQISGAERSSKGLAFRSAVQLADALDVSLDYLAGRTPNPTAHK